jgi:hypothetical protein
MEEDVSSWSGRGPKLVAHMRLVPRLEMSDTIISLEHVGKGKTVCVVNTSSYIVSNGRLNNQQYIVRQAQGNGHDLNLWSRYPLRNSKHSLPK